MTMIFFCVLGIGWILIGLNWRYESIVCIWNCSRLSWLLSGISNCLHFFIVQFLTFVIRPFPTCGSFVHQPKRLFVLFVDGWKNDRALWSSNKTIEVESGLYSTFKRGIFECFLLLLTFDRFWRKKMKFC